MDEIKRPFSDEDVKATQDLVRRHGRLTDDQRVLILCALQNYRRRLDELWTNAEQARANAEQARAKAPVGASFGEAAK